MRSAQASVFSEALGKLTWLGATADGSRSLGTLQRELSAHKTEAEYWMDTGPAAPSPAQIMFMIWGDCGRVTQHPAGKSGMSVMPRSWAGALKLIHDTDTPWELKFLFPRWGR